MGVYFEDFQTSDGNASMASAILISFLKFFSSQSVCDIALSTGMAIGNDINAQRNNPPLINGAVLGEGAQHWGLLLV
jgi:hypothetical protein